MGALAQWANMQEDRDTAAVDGLADLGHSSRTLRSLETDGDKARLA